MSIEGLSLERDGVGWRLVGEAADGFGLVNDYLSYLADRNYSPRTIRSYGFGLLAFCRWLSAEGIGLSAVSTDVLLRFLAACRTEWTIRTGKRGVLALALHLHFEGRRRGRRGEKLGEQEEREHGGPRVCGGVCLQVSWAGKR